ncbi:histidine phosphatase family protein [Blastomonas sp.]|uniref:SixA phosphatase family protein n=1 Tax=Blastomonas sp. TaxID=1909299 RepID=UPI0035944C8B
MKTLTLLRHAKSDWNDRSMRDFDRPLNDRGVRGARAMGAFVAEKQTAFDAVLASPAVRVTETIDQFEQTYGRTLNPDWDRRIYLASSVTLIDVLRGQPDTVAHVMMIGHNPGLEDLIFDLVPDDGSSPLRDVVEEKFPTATLAVMDIDIDHWADLDNGSARLTAITRPRDLDPDLGPTDDD